MLAAYAVMTDKGFDISDELINLGLSIAPFLVNQSAFTEDNAIKTQRVE